MSASLAVPGVYYEPRPRAVPRPLARTDVAGFLGFEPRVTDGASPTRLTGTPASGHSFHVAVRAFQLPAGGLDGKRAQVQGNPDLLLSQAPATVPMAPGGAIAYAVFVVRDPDGAVRLRVAAGAPSIGVLAAAPSDLHLQGLAGASPWRRLADVRVNRSTDGQRVRPVVIPALPPTRCDDWNDFVLQLGGLPARDDGTLLARSVRAYFANGGSRCHVVTVRRPRFDDPGGLAEAAADLVGLADASEVEATGLERLLRVFEVAIVDAPDLYARHVDPGVEALRLPPRARDACFRRCGDEAPPGVVTASGPHAADAPLFDDTAVLAVQRAMLLRCAPERWRVCLLLAAPVHLDPAVGRYRGPDAERSTAWRQQLAGVVDDLGASCGAFYHPWVLAQETVGAPVVELPPTALAAGILARRDVARGPHVSAANERLIGVVGLSPPVDDAQHARLCDVPLNINPLRAFPGQGIQVWGARTLSSERWMRYLAVRRGLSAIERRMVTALRPLVFEPNTPTLWFQVTQAALAVLVPVFEAGALRGDTTDEAFYVRCDGTNNPSESIAEGRVVCEVGVALAAPAEFIVFRVGRREAVVELLE